MYGNLPAGRIIIHLNGLCMSSKDNEEYVALESNHQFTSMEEQKISAAEKTHK